MLLMANHTGVTSARAVYKRCSSPSLSRSSSTNKLVRRRGKGSLVRSRAFVWSKEDLQKLHDLAKRPRHEIPTDVVNHHTLPRSPSEPCFPDNSPLTHGDDMLHNQHPTLSKAVHHQPIHVEELLNSYSTDMCRPVADVTTSKPPLQRQHHSTHLVCDRTQNVQLSAHVHHSVMSESSPANSSNLSVVAGLASRLIDLAL